MINAKIGERVKMAKHGSTTGKITNLVHLCSTSSELWRMQYNRIGLSGSREPASLMAVVRFDGGVGELLCAVKDLERVPAEVTPAHREAAFKALSLQNSDISYNHNFNSALCRWFRSGDAQGTAHNWSGLNAEAKRIAEAEAAE